MENHKIQKNYEIMYNISFSNTNILNKTMNLNIDGIDTTVFNKNLHLKNLRNQLICKLHIEKKIPIADVAKIFNQSAPRVYQIIRDYKNK